MTRFGFVDMLFTLVSVSKLNGRVAVAVLCLDLGYDARTSFNDGAGVLLAIRSEDAGHPDFLSNDTFHCVLYLYPARLYRTVGQ